MVYYLHGDHLGSTNVVSGAAISQQTYYAYGLPRTTEGTLPTDYAFTGQRQDSDGLLYYGARYYEAYLNRWTQPDSIIPDWYNPQSLNRYVYTLNNPVKYTDPTGHMETCDDDVCSHTIKPIQEQEKRIAKLDEAGRWLLANGYTDLDFLVSMTRLAAELTNNNSYDFVDDMTILTWGWHTEQAGYLGLRGFAYARDHGYISPGNLMEPLQRGGTGFAVGFQDPPTDVIRSNQVGHFWEYVAIAYWDGVLEAEVGNWYHEYGPGQTGGSWQDFALGREGVQLGVRLATRGLKPRDVSQWVQDHLK